MGDDVRGRRGLVTSLLGALVLTACGQVQGPLTAVSKDDLRPSMPVVPPTPSGPQGVDHQVAGEWPAQCGTADGGLVLGWSAVEAGLGHRYLTLAVRNCAKRPVPVPARASLTARDAQGVEIPLELQWQPSRIDSEVIPRGLVFLSLHWMSNGHCEQGAASLTVSFAAVEGTATGCLQLGNFETRDASSDNSSEVRIGWTRTPQAQ